ncbi:MAG: hypothetical protein RSG23_08700 [Gordonibacter sp.]|uniref:hypothetical protein n=1 Tax=Gordonibacter sp. TaxID=1968902 RepID=UPI002FC62899
MSKEPTYYPLNNEAARAAHSANSFREFHSDAADYRAEVDEAYELADWAAERNPERAEEAYSLAGRYAQRFAEWYNKGYAIESMCPSMLVSGRANFPVKKKERQNASREKHMDNYDALKGILAKIRRIGTGADIIKSNDQNAAEKLRAKIAQLEANHEVMKKANAEARKNGEESPYPSWKLSNNRQNINAAKKRLASIEAQKERGTAKGEAVIKGEQCRVIENAELMRLQLVFDGKPCDEAREALKHWGFRWSPKNGAWQRQLTGNARFALRQLVDKE